MGVLFSGDLGISPTWLMQLFASGIILGFTFLAFAIAYIWLRVFFSRWLWPKRILLVARVYLAVQVLLLVIMIIIVGYWAKRFENGSAWQYFWLMIEAVLEEVIILIPAIASMIIWYFISKRIKLLVVPQDA